MESINKVNCSICCLYLKTDSNSELQGKWVRIESYLHQKKLQYFLDTIKMPAHPHSVQGPLESTWYDRTNAVLLHFVLPSASLPCYWHMNRKRHCLKLIRDHEKKLKLHRTKVFKHQKPYILRKNILKYKINFIKERQLWILGAEQMPGPANIMLVLDYLLI